MAKQHDSEKAERITKAREHYAARKIGRPVQKWADGAWVKA